MPDLKRFIWYLPLATLKSEGIAFSKLIAWNNSTGKDHLTNLAKQFKVDVQSASTQYFKEIGKIADPPVQFEMRYRFNGDILNKEKY